MPDAAAGDGPTRDASTIGDALAPGDAAAQPDASSAPDGAAAACTPDPTLKLVNGVPVGCAAKPSACCYPDATNSGVPAGVALTASGSLSIKTDGTVVSGLDVSGTIDIYAKNVTIESTRVTTDSPGSFAVAIRPGATGTTIRDTTIRGMDNGTHSVEYGVFNIAGTAVTVTRANLYNCSECIMGASITLTDSYLHDTADPPGAHVEDIYGLAGSSYKHNTILNAVDQTAAVYLDPNLGGTLDCKCSLVDNLLAGGGYTIYGGGSGNMSATNVKITGNRFARSYFANSGSYGVDAYFDGAAMGNSWSGNFWDDTAAAVGP
jgi:hypothetical protein